MSISQFHGSSDKYIYYNVHNLFRIKSDIDLGLRYFECPESQYPVDFIISTIDYDTPDKHNYQQVASGLYYSKSQNSIVSNMSFLGVKTHWEIRDILSDVTELRISKSFVFLSKYILFSPISSVHNLIGLTRMIVQLKLLLKGYSFLIGACCHWNDQILIFTGAGGCGKTSSVVNFATANDADFMSDDFLIIGENTVFSYPTPLRIRKYNLDFISYSKFVDPVEDFTWKIKDAATSECKIFFLEKSSSDFLRSIPSREGIEKLCNLNNRALLYMHERVLSFLPYLYEELSLLKLQEKQFNLITRCLSESDFFIMSAPDTKNYLEMLDRSYKMRPCAHASI